MSISGVFAGFWAVAAVLPLGLIIAGIVAAKVKQDKGWYLLTIVGCFALIQVVRGLVNSLVFGFLLGGLMAQFGLFPIPR